MVVEELVRRLFAAFQAQDRAAADELLAEDFTFSSPRDEGFDRAGYFEECWPHASALASITLEQIFTEGDDALVRYTAVRAADGVRFRNVEFIRTDGVRIKEVEVFFGRELG